MPRILLVNAHSAHRLSGVHNRGSAAFYASTIGTLRKLIPDAEFATFIQMPPEFADKHGVRVIRNKLFYNKPFSVRTILRSWCNLLRAGLFRPLGGRLPALSSVLAGGKDLKEFARADVILDVSMDLYGDDFGTVSVMEHSKDILIGVMMRKPVVIWAHSLGPFRSKWTSWLARLALERTALITVREETSLAHLRELGIKRPPIHVVADPAFLLEPAARERAAEILSSEGIQSDVRPLVGVTMSWTTLLAESRGSRYLDLAKSGYRLLRVLLPEPVFGLIERGAGRFKRFNKGSFLKVGAMSDLVDYLVDRLGATVVLVPHDTDPVLDDRVLARRIADNVQHKSRVAVIAGDYSSSELKAVIGTCDLFVGGKMHANIAALSMGIPTLAIEYHHKFRGIMRLMGQEEYVCSSLPELKEKTGSAWANSSAIRNELGLRSQPVKQKALLNGDLVRGLLQSRSGSVPSSAPDAT